MPWMTCTQDCNTRPSLISHALWNIQQESTTSILRNDLASSSGSSLQLPQPLQQHTSRISLQPNRETWGKPSGPVSSATNPIQLRSSSTTHSIGLMSTRFILAVIWLYLRSSSSSGTTKAAVQHISTPVIGYQRNPHLSQIHVVMSRKSCLRRTKAIIQ